MGICMPSEYCALTNATLGVLTSASLAVHTMGQGLAQALGKLSKHRGETG